jgi:hypothetical protein
MTERKSRGSWAMKAADSQRSESSDDDDGRQKRFCVQGSIL